MTVRQKLSETESTFAFLIGGGLFLLMLGFGIAGLRPASTDNSLTNGIMIVGGLMLVVGSIGWAIITEPWRNFDNWSKPLFTGHEHDEPHAEAAHEDHAPATAHVAVAEPVVPAHKPHAPAPAHVEAAPAVQAKVEKVAPAAPAEPAREASKRDDLQEIEGIGPKIAAALYGAGIETFSHLAAMPAPDVERIVKTAGVRMGSGRADGWVEQAKLAAAGKTDELVALQKELRSRKS